MKKILRLIYIIVIEAYATLRHVIPSALFWLYKRKISQQITHLKTVAKVKIEAHLYLYGKISTHGRPLLFLHGDHCHSYTMHHLMREAHRQQHGPIFTLHIPSAHRDDLFETHVELVQLAIDHIEEFVILHGGSFDGVVGIGHSKGAILLAHTQFAGATKIHQTISIAGRLNVSHEDTQSEPLKNKIQTLYKQICDKPERSLVQIIPKQDWNVPYASMAVRPEMHCYTVPGMHLSGLYSKSTANLFKEILTEHRQGNGKQRVE